jgi:pyruvate/2-oxoglutarate dehydrogenase complex dihydrolipoamide acyltransferase (E2) component
LELQYYASDDTIEVGYDLYDIDTEAETTVAASEAPASSEEPKSDAPAAKAEPAVAAVTTDSGMKSETSHRVPSTKFLGKEGWARALSAAGSAPAAYAIPADDGRPGFSDVAIGALVLGGANLVLDVKNYSSGAKFGH